ncbi:MAG: 23S rRNA (adenine(2503)-C(2))-methyltransferase RlmN [Gammaproteobacteria bacterium]|nr:MAG: 23S rRNA (adenine(2503)-C(2))-methyltransferase RlmN [Gammaproteobacteria bacterium]
MNTAKTKSKINLLGLSHQELTDFFISIDEKPFRATQIIKWVHQRGISDISEMTDLSKSLREKLLADCEIKAPEVVYEKLSKDGTKKWVIKAGEKDLIEMVLIPEKNRATLCVSSQVGCAVDCSFCATGKQGFSRNLSLDEIIGQVWVAANSFGLPREPNSRHITNVVMMGMGEPLLNFEPVVNAMNLMTDDNAYGLSKRKVTLSTSGIVPKIDELSKVSDVALTISLHAPNDALRNELVPINKKYPIQVLLDSVKRYVDSCDDKRVTTIEYILINGINDELAHAEELSILLKQLSCKINLIPFNAFEGSDYLKPSGNRVKRFQQHLQDQGYITTIRSTRGDDIMAACGQLVGQVNDKTRRKERAQKNQIKTKAI